MRRPIRPTYFYVEVGKHEEHAEKLKRGLSMMCEGFAAEICRLCDGQGQYRQTYTLGCGGGYYSASDDCNYCERTGLRMQGSPAPLSVVYQVLNAAESVQCQAA